MMRVLLNTQRRELHDVLIRHGVDPAVTKWTKDKKGWTNSSVDTLEAGLCHFLFNADSDGTFSVHMKPSVDGRGVLGDVHLSWLEVRNLFEAWTIHVKGELAQDDPWQQYSAYLPPERLVDGTDNAPFTHKEAEHVAQSVRILQDYIRKKIPDYDKVSKQFDPQFERIAARAKDGAGRIDWSNQFVGMLIGLCMALALAPDAASEIWTYWVQVINGLLLP